MDRSQLLVRVLLALGATGCQSTQSTSAATTIHVDATQAPEPPGQGVEGDKLPGRSDPIRAAWQPDEPNAGCTRARELPQGFDHPRFTGCPTQLQRMSSTSFDALRTPRPPQFAPEDDLRFDEPLTARARAEGDSEACCYRRAYELAVPGRPLRSGADLLLPELRTRALGQPQHERLGGELLQVDWSESARYEHASSASFMRFALDLLALGAPRALVDAACIAARQELQHAQLALSLARLQNGDEADFGGAALSPQLVQESPGARVLRVARELLIDAALGEGQAALEAFEQAAVAPPEIQPALQQLARDETEHALLGWRSLAWLVAQQPELRPQLRCWLAEAEERAVGDRRALIREVMQPGLELLLRGQQRPAVSGAQVALA